MTTEMDMVERVARAIDDATWTNFDNYAGLKGWSEAERTTEMLASRSIQKSIGNARAAIEAMREPTKGMLDDGRYAIGDLEADVSKEVWQAMIDAALTSDAAS